MLSSAAQTHGSANAKSFHQLLFPASTYMIDDGTAEDAIGLTFGGDVIALNEFAVIPGAETITTVSIAWGTPVFPDPTLNGLSYTVCIWSDPNGDGNPNDAVLLATAPGTISSQGTNTFLTTDVADTTITTANFFVGFLVTHAGGQFPSAFDQTAPTFSNRSYIAGDSVSGDIMNLNNNELPVAPIESFGLVGNWLIRADAAPAGPLELLSVASRKHHGEAGDFDIDLPSDGSGIECRQGDGSNREKIRFTFNQTVTSVDSSSTSCGSVQRTTIDGGAVEVETLGNCNGSEVTVTLNGIHSGGGDLDSVAVTFGVLIGDVNADGVVNNADLAEVRANVGRGLVTEPNFRDDVTVSGRINHADSTLVRASRGTSLP